MPEHTGWSKKVIQEHIEYCNLAWIFFIKCIAVTFVVADGP